MEEASDNNYCFIVLFLCSPQMAVKEMIMGNPLGHVTPRKAGRVVVSFVCFGCTCSYGGRPLYLEFRVTYFCSSLITGIVDCIIVYTSFVTCTGLSQYLTIFIHPYEVLKNPALSKPSGGVVLSKQEVSLDLGVAVKMKMEKSYQVNRLSVIPNLFE